MEQLQHTSDIIEFFPSQIEYQPQRLAPRVYEACRSIMYAINNSNYRLKSPVHIIHSDQYTQLELLAKQYATLHAGKNVVALSNIILEMQTLASQEAHEVFLELEIGAQTKTELQKVIDYLSDTVKYNQGKEWTCTVKQVDRDDVHEAAPGITFIINFKCLIAETI